MLLANKDLKGMVKREVEALGYILWGVELVPTRHSCLVRVYIDGMANIAVSDCEKVNKHLAMCMKRENCHFEVSSPGLARKFFEPKQYKDYIGQEIKLKMRVSINGKRNYSGQLLSVDERIVVLQDTDGAMEISHDQIEKAQLQPDYRYIFTR